MSMNEQENLPPIQIPQSSLSPEALNGLLEEFILREGTDYGNHEYSLEDKKEHILKQLASKKVVIVFDQHEETATIIRSEALNCS